MKNENDKFDYQRQQKDNYVEYMFIFILFLVAFGLSLIALFFIAWMLDWFSGVYSIPDGWA